MPLDPVKNFAKVIVSTGYADGVSSIDLQSGDAAKLPDIEDGEFNLVWWNSTDYPDPSDDPNVEIVRVTDIEGDTLTIDRAQEGTSDVDHNTEGKTYKMILAITEKMIGDIDSNLEALSPAGSEGDVQLVDGDGEFDADSDFNWDKDNHRLTLGGNPTITSKDGANDDGEDLVIKAGDVASGADHKGGNLVLRGGDPTTGSGTGDGDGGDVIVTPSPALNDGIPGNVILGIEGAGILDPDAVAGFAYIPAIDGTPVGTPAKTYDGKVPMVYDATNDILYIYNSGWIAIN